jgi:luciferase family oxidoreductase group 1
MAPRHYATRWSWPSSPTGLGYERYWLAEHHNLPSIASSAPEIMIGHVANVTERIRVGADGIMLPNHTPLKVVETFQVLEALHPERIDLGIGRAGHRPCDGPGPAPLAGRARCRGLSAAVRRASCLLRGRLPRGSSFPIRGRHAERCRAAADLTLGSSGYSARAAGEMDLGYAFASHFSPADPAPAIHAYRESFEPSEDFERPLAVLAVAVVCGETTEHAERLATSMELAWVRMRGGASEPLPSPEEAMAYRYRPAECRLANSYRSMQIVGDPQTVRARIEELAKRTAADEVLVTTNVYDHAERLRSYELLADLFEIATPGR